jgi:hypothetical protein
VRCELAEKIARAGVWSSSPDCVSLSIRVELESFRLMHAQLPMLAPRHARATSMARSSSGDRRDVDVEFRSRSGEPLECRRRAAVTADALPSCAKTSGPSPRALLGEGEQRHCQPPKSIATMWSASYSTSPFIR